MGSQTDDIIEEDEPELDEAAKLRPASSMVVLECVGHRSTMLGGECGSTQLGVHM